MNGTTRCGISGLKKGISHNENRDLRFGNLFSRCPVKALGDFRKPSGLEALCVGVFLYVFRLFRLCGEAYQG